MTRNIARQLHLWIGLILCIPLVLLGLSGSILVYEDELRAMFAPPAHATAGEAKPVSAIVAAALATAPAGSTVQSYVAPRPGGFATVRLSGPRGSLQSSAAATGPVGGGEPLRVTVDPVSLAASGNPSEGFMRQVFYLHTTLLLKSRDGRQLVGYLGVVMLMMGLSGLVNWLPRRFQWRNGTWRQAFTVRRGASGFRLNRELHSAAGIWGLIVFLVVTFGGIELAFPETMRNIVNVVMPARDLRAVALAIKIEPRRGVDAMPIDDAVALARGAVPDANLRMVFMPARPEQPMRITFVRTGQDHHEPTATVFVDPFARKVVQTLDPGQYSAGEALLAWQHAIHSGEGLGFVWRALVFVCGFLPAMFAVTGVAMWWLKRRLRGPAASEADTMLDPGYTARRAGE